MKTFEDYLNEKCFEENPSVLDDDMPDFLDNWLTELQADDFIEYAQEWGEQEVKKVSKSI